jgi:hypothetical protein
MTTMPATHPTAPAAPGSLGASPEPAVLQTYLQALEAWVRGRKLELDELDAAALAAGRGGEVAGDMGLSLALWKAVSDRYAEMWALWDGGRVLGAEREKISALIWGRLDAAGSSLPEACRLSDALAAQLRMKLALSPGADAAASRVRDLRAQLERIRDQVGLEPALTRDAAVDRLAALMARLEDIADRAGRGADVLGMLAPLEQDAATYERDLIVGNARRRDARGQVIEARKHRAELLARETELEELAATCVATVDPAPRLAVPDVDALGPVPNTPDAIGPYLERLDRVDQAMDYAHERYATALAQHQGLLDLLRGYVMKAEELTTSEAQARAVLARRPAPIAVCQQLVATYRTWLDQLTGRAVVHKELP